MADDAGSLLVRSGLISEEQLLLARQAQVGRGGTVGEHLVLAGFVEDQKLAEFYRTSLMVPQVNPKQLTRISRALIDLIPADMATEFRCIPVRLDSESNLTLAMADPSATHTVDEIAFFTRKYVVRAVATQAQVAWCLAHYYTTLTPLGQRLQDGLDEVALPGPMPSVDIPETTARPSEPVSSPRKPSITGRVQQSRHQVLPPVTSPPLNRPSELAESRQQTATAAEQHGPGGRAAAEAQPDPAPPALPYSLTADGDIAVKENDSAGSSGPVPVAIEPEPKPLQERQRPTFSSRRKQRVISFLNEETAPTGPMRTLERTEVQPPELYDRAGEVEVPTGPIQILEDTLPSVVVSMARSSDSGPLVHRRLRPPEEQPLPLPEPPTSISPPSLPPLEETPQADMTAPEPADDSEQEDEKRDDGVVLLDRPKGKHAHSRRRSRKTELGLGITPSLLTQLADSGKQDSDEWDEPYLELHTDSEDAEDSEDDEDSEDTDVRDIPSDQEETHVREPRDTDPIDDDPDEVTHPELPRSSVSGPVITESESALEPGLESRDVEEADSAAVSLEADIGPTEQMDTPLTEMRGPSGSLVLDPADSIASAAEAAAEAHARARARGDSSQAIPLPILDDPASGSEFLDEETNQFEPTSRDTNHNEDDEWGPPGSTIPPPFLGAVTEADEADSGPSHIPIFTDHLTDEDPIGIEVRTGSDSPAGESSQQDGGAIAPTALSDGAPDSFEPYDSAAHSSPQRDVSAIGVDPASAREGTASVSVPAEAETEIEIESADHAAPRPGSAEGHGDSARMRARSVEEPINHADMRDLEDSSFQLVGILRDLDQADTRDQVVEILTAHLAESHSRVAFFAVQGDKLSIWKLRVDGTAREADERVTLTLDKPSTFQDIVSTRLPFRGPLGDPVSQSFIEQTFGAEAADMLGLPVAIRGRVVGVLYSDGNFKRVFQQHLAVVTRAAGVAFERILKRNKHL
ncbi:MAG: hypothetical protein MJE77_23500 [Proteobacteria bacterium]|nr:hypothetical protein [Pseudomonadota bacterium]